VVRFPLTPPIRTAVETAIRESELPVTAETVMRTTTPTLTATLSADVKSVLNVIGIEARRSRHNASRREGSLQEPNRDRPDTQLDFTTWLLGVNVMPLYTRLPPIQLPPSLYVHVGPVIVGFYGAPR
jgi:hypothetical protein